MDVIFVGGCERSGTTLLGTILGRIPGAVCTPESQFKYGLCEADCSGDMRVVKNSFRLSLWGLKDGTINDCIRRSSTGKELLHHLVKAYGENTVNEGSAKIWVDHTPTNLKKSWYLDRYFPHAKYIHIVRDGRGVAASVMPLDWGPNTALWAGPWWAEQIGHGLAAEKMIGERVLQVKYEKLLKEPSHVLSKIARYFELPVDAQSISQSSSDFQVPSYSDSQHELIGSSINESRATAWRSELSDRQIRDFESGASDMIQLLGYKCSVNGQIDKMGMSYKAFRFLQDKCVINIINKIRNYTRRKFSNFS